MTHNLTIHPITVRLLHQSLNTTRTAKDEPYSFKADPVDLTTLTEDQLSHIYSESQAIQTAIANETLRRAKAV